MLNARVPQQNEYHSMIPGNQPNHAMSYVDASMHQDRGQELGLQQEGCNSGERDRWPVGGQGHRNGSPNASYRSHFSGFDERGAGDGMMWQSHEEVRMLLFRII